MTKDIENTAKNSHSRPQYQNIRKATPTDISRIAEIYVFNNRLVYFPILHDLLFSFKELQVQSYIKKVEQRLIDTYVYDDGVVKGFIVITGKEIKKLHVDYFFQGQGIGGCMLQYAVQCCFADYVWVFENNEGAVNFYQKKGFVQTSEKNKFICSDGHIEFLVKMSMISNG